MLLVLKLPQHRNVCVDISVEAHTAILGPGAFQHDIRLHVRVFSFTTRLTTDPVPRPNANTPDPNFGICLQCAAVDRARTKITPAVARSSICAQCFQQYCFDPQHPPSQSELPNRKLTFKDPTPQGLTKVTGFLGSNKFKLLGGMIGLVVFIAALSGGL